MATIDELDFKLVVDDADFNTKIASAKQSALELNTALSNYLNLVNRVNSASINGLTGWTQMATEAKNLKAAMEEVLSTIKSAKSEAKDIGKGLKDAGKAADSANKSVNKMKTSLSTAANSSKTMANAMEKVDNKTGSATKKLEDLKTAAEDAAAATQGIQVSLTGASSESQKQSAAFGNLARLAATYFSVRYVKNFATEVAKVTGEFELQRTSLQNILQDVSGANKIFEQIKDFSVESPFQFKDLTDYVKQLSAYSIPMNELFDTTKMLADVSAGLGVDMNRIVLAYGQIRSASFLRGQEVRQLTEAGIPILEELRKQFEEMGEIGITAGQVFDKISNRQVGFQMVEKVFKNMTEEGGKFYKMQEVQAQTLAGKISNLKDAYDIMLNSFGEATRGPLVATIDTLKNIMEHYQAVGRTLVDIFAMFGSYALIRGLSKLLDTFKKMGTAMSTATGFFGKISAGLGEIGISAGAAYVAIGVLVSLLGIQLYKSLTEVNRELNKLVNQNFSNFKKESENLDKVVQSLKNATQGSQNYRDAITRLNGQYGEYLSNLATEADSWGKIKLAADAAKEAISAKYQSEAMESGEKWIDDHYGDRLSEAREKLIEWFTDPFNARGIDEDAAKALIAKFAEALKDEANNDKLGEDVMKEIIDSFFATRGGVKGVLIEELDTEVDNYAAIYRKVEKARSELKKKVDDRYRNDTPYDTEEEAKKISKIDLEYQAEKSRINATAMTEEQKNIELLKAQKKYLEELIAAYKELGRTEVANDYQKQLDELNKVAVGWRKVVEDVLNDKKLNFSETTKKILATNDGEQYLEWLKKLREEYSKLDQNIKDFSGVGSTDDMKEKADLLKDEKKAAEALAQALGFSLDKPAQQRKTANQLRSEEKQRILNDINEIKSLKSQYEQLLDLGMSPKDAQGELEAFFPEHKQTIETLDFAGAIRKYANELEGLGEVQEANKVRSTLMVDELKDYVTLLKEKQNYESKLEEFIQKGIEESGSGVEFDISKIVWKYKTTLNDIERETRKMTEETQSDFNKGTLSAEDYNKALDAIASSKKVQDANALNSSLESIRNEADKLIKDWAKMKGIDLNYWSRKSVKELEDIINDLDEYAKTGVVPDGIKEKLSDVTGGVETFKQTLLDLIDSYKGEASDAKDGKTFWEKLFGGLNEEQVKDKLKTIKACVKYIRELTKSLMEFAEDTSDTEMKSTLTALSDFMDIAGAIAEGFAAGGPWAAVAAGIASVGSKALQAATEARELERALYDVRMEARETAYESILKSGEDSIFGSSFIASLRNAMTVFNQSASSLSTMNANLKQVAQSVRDFIETGTTIDGFPYMSERQNATLKAMNKGYSDLASYAVKVKTSFLKRSEYKSIGELMDGMDLDITDKWGNLNADSLQKVLNAYKKLGDADAEWIKQAIKDSKAYASAMEQLESNLSNLFGSLADSIADSMISAFEETGDAMYDLTDDFAKVGETLTKSLLSSLIIDSIFTQYKDELLKASQDYGNGDLTEAQMMQRVADIMSMMQGSLESQGDVYNAILEYADQLGWLSDSENDGLNSGIKGITEETADLLASYINAIRADVSYARVQRETIIGQIEQIISGLPTAPNLQYYMSQLEANTANIAETSASILDRIDSVLTSEGGSTAFRTYAH